MKKENIYGSLGILPKEEMLEAKQNFQKLTIGLPKETSFQENRISLSPDSVSLLTHNGHKIIIENNESVYHFDFYRIEKEEEAFDIGYEEYFYQGNLCLIEWPEKISSIIPENIIKVQITRSDEQRIIEII